jgi:hypothetical protein
MRKNQHLEEATQATKFMVYVPSVEPDESNWDNPGHWETYEHKIVADVNPVMDLFDVVEVALFDKIQNGEFTIEGDLWCEEIEEVFAPKNIQSIAKRSKSMDEFIENLIWKIRRACMNYWENNTEDEVNLEPTIDEYFSEAMEDSMERGWGVYR